MRTRVTKKKALPTSLPSRFGSTSSHRERGWNDGGVDEGHHRQSNARKTYFFVRVPFCKTPGARKRGRTFTYESITSFLHHEQQQQQQQHHNHHHHHHIHHLKCSTTPLPRALAFFSSHPFRFRKRSRSPRRSRSRSRSMSRERDRDRRSRSGSRDRR